MRKNLSEVISEGIDLTDKIRSISLDDSQREGVSYIKKAVDYGGIAVGVGPPGTGKTQVFSYVIARRYSELEKDEAIIYIAPTNSLVGEAAIRTIACIVNENKGYKEEDLKNSIRVYGSRYEPLRLDESVKLIFTTGYQPGALKRLTEAKKRIHLLIDEASTTALHEALMPLSMSIEQKLMKEKAKSIEFIGSFSVIGDPMQALVDPNYGWRWKIEQLIVSRLIMALIPENEREEVIELPPMMFELAKRYAGSSDIKYFFLDRTFRMPKPTELLVSIPFYNRMVTAVRDYNEAMKDIESNVTCSSLRNDAKFLNRIESTIEEAISSKYPIVYIRDTKSAYYGQRSKGLDDYDEYRAILGAEIAAYLARKTTLTRITVITPYNEMVTQSQFHIKRFERHLGDRKRSISFKTIHSSLGLDSEAVIVVMGKEHKGEEFETIYYQSPELINVQFSRHMKMLIIIGNIEKLAKNMETKYPYVGKIKESLEELKKEDKIKITNLPTK